MQQLISRTAVGSNIAMFHAWLHSYEPSETNQRETLRMWIARMDVLMDWRPVSGPTLSDLRSARYYRWLPT